MKTNRVLAVLGIVAVLVVTAMLAGCGGHQTLLFVADGINNRVLVYDAPFFTGQSAAAVLGQAAFNTAAAPNPPTAASMARPNVMVDTSGTLYVTDGNNCRVLQFIPPFATGMNATLAIGQPAGVGNLISNTCLQGAAATASGLDIPAGMAFDSAGNLWVADIGNSRVLKYPAPLTAGEAATVVLGQTTLTGAGTCNQGNAAPSATTLCQPTVIAFDSAGNLWVVDAGNNRMLMYSPANLVTGGAATAELGQPAATAFTTGTANNGGVSATSLSDPQSLAFDPQGNLWLTDFNNNRVLMYAKVDLMVNGAPATLEFGQPIATAFTSATANNGGIGPSTLSGPVGLAFDRGGSAYVTEGGNNRTLVFVPPFSNGMNATLVIGQPDFTHNTANNGGESAATQSDPLGTAVF